MRFASELGGMEVDSKKGEDARMKRKGMEWFLILRFVTRCVFLVRYYAQYLWSGKQRYML